MKSSKSEIRLSGIDVFYCDYCGERIDKTEPCIILQNVIEHNGIASTQLRHKECQNL